MIRSIIRSIIRSRSTGRWWWWWQVGDAVVHRSATFNYFNYFNYFNLKKTATTSDLAVG